MPTYPTWDIEAIKDDIGMTVPADEPWLNRRLEGLWASIRKYTARYLCPVGTFVDDWTNTHEERLAFSHPPISVGNSIFLTQFPVLSILKCEIVTTSTMTEIDPATILFDPRTGQLKGTQIGGTPMSMLNSKITYQAGLSDVPLDIYEAMIGILSKLYASRQQAGGMVNGMQTNYARIDDVGIMKFIDPDYGFDAKIASLDPIMGPYIAILDGYKDWRNKIGIAGASQFSIVDVPFKAGAANEHR